MLIAQHGRHRYEAATALKGFPFVCPSCGQPVTLKQGQIKIAHFAHKPPTTCSWASGETSDHYKAKVSLRDALRFAGYLAEYEVEVLSVSGDRRADVLAASQDGRNRWAIEVQHSPLLYPAIHARTQAYLAAQVPVIWMGVLTEKMKESAEPTAGGVQIKQYSVRPWEKWAKALHFGELWYVDPSDGTLWQGKFSDHQMYVEPTTWYESGVEQSAGGYTKKSKRWRTLTLRGPFLASQLVLSMQRRTAWSSSAFSLPPGLIGKITTR